MNCRGCGTRIAFGSHFCSDCGEPVPRAEPIANRYRIERLLGTGALGNFYLAHDEWEHRDLCLKVIRPDLVADSRLSDRFLREGTVARRLHHPNIVSVSDVGRDRDTTFIAMEHLPGRSLRAWLDEWADSRRDVPLDIAAAITVEILRALDGAHRQSVVHHDLKPENVMLLDELDEGVVRLKLLDFGIARALRPIEAVTGNEAGPEADLHSAGVIFYELLTGTPPSGNRNPPSSVREDLGPNVDEVCMKALDPEPRRRFESAGEFACALADLAKQASRSDGRSDERFGGRPDLAALLAPEPRADRLARRPRAAPPPPPPPAESRVDADEAFRRLVSSHEWKISENLQNVAGLAQAMHVSTGLEFVLIPEGRFLMGATGMGPCEEPLHWVSVAPFLISATPCDREAWGAVLGRGGSYGRDPREPATKVTFEAAKEWCDRAGGGLRLPSEAEWEFACRAGTRTAWSFGNDEVLLPDYAWFLWNSEERPRPVGTRLPNPWGLFDMHGNVWEWCEDLWHESYHGAPDDGSAWVTAADAEANVFRGGSWVSDPNTCRSAYRGWAGPEFEGRFLGFRPAVSLP